MATLPIGWFGNDSRGVPMVWNFGADPHTKLGFKDYFYYIAILLATDERVRAHPDPNRIFNFPGGNYPQPQGLIVFANQWRRMRVIDRRDVPPTATARTGDDYIVGTSPTDEWIGKANDLAWFRHIGVWDFVTPETGRLIIDDSGTAFVFDGSVWETVSDVSLIDTYQAHERRTTESAIAGQFKGDYRFNWGHGCIGSDVRGPTSPGSNRWRLLTYWLKPTANLINSPVDFALEGATQIYYSFKTLINEAGFNFAADYESPFSPSVFSTLDQDKYVEIHTTLQKLTRMAIGHWRNVGNFPSTPTDSADQRISFVSNIGSGSTFSYELLNTRPYPHNTEVDFYFDNVLQESNITPTTVSDGLPPWGSSERWKTLFAYPQINIQTPPSSAVFVINHDVAGGFQFV